MNRVLTRRDFFKTSAIYSTLGLAPHFLAASAGAQQLGGASGKVLVVVQLGGGNDGLNTLVPYEDDAYRRARPTLGLGRDRVIPIDGSLGFHQELAGLADVYEDGKLAIVQGVGYPNPDRSHFRSMEIWHTASDSEEFRRRGWIGRYFDHACDGSAKPHVGVAVGRERPQAFDGDGGLGVAFRDARNFGWSEGQASDSAQAFARINAGHSGDETVDFLRHVTSSAIASSQEVRDAALRSDLRRRKRVSLDYSLDVVAAMIKGELDTRIFYVSVSGFDTHADQRGPHERLLAQGGKALKAFQDRLRRDGTSDRVLTMVFSEFGRRVEENKSGGTDHGTANPMFLMGDGVNPGLHGTAPSLTDLDDGDLKHTVDFRRVYATLLSDWLDADPAAVLGRGYDPMRILS